MYVNYTELPGVSRVWIYQSNRYISTEELELISVRAINFIDQWTRHGDDLKASFTVKYNQFFVLAVDETFNSVSGCSIDASVRFVKELEKELNIDLTDKLNVSFKKDDVVKLLKLSDFQEAVAGGELTSETIVFNNMVANKSDLETKWEVQLKDSWHSRFLK